jgi:hypothetical protein
MPIFAAYIAGSKPEPVIFLGRFEINSAVKTLFVA